MDPLVAWLTSTFGASAPDVAASMGIPPPAPVPSFNDRFSAVGDNPRVAAAMDFGTPLPDEASTLPPQPARGPSFAGAGAPQQSPDFPPASSVWDPQQAMAAAPPAAAAGATPPGGTALSNALRGIAAPTVPAAQKVSTPSAPRMADIKGNELLQFLLATQDAGGQGGRKINPLPGTLGQALNVPRY